MRRRLGGRDLYQAKAERKQLERFVRSHLGFDGVLVLRLFSMNAGFVLTYDVLRLLWTRYRPQPDAPANDAPEVSAEPGNAPNDQSPHRRNRLFPNLFGRGSHKGEQSV